jgi:hypothetical protein
VSTQCLISIECILRLFGCICFSWFHSQGRGYGLAAPSARLSRVALLALLADLVV